MEKQHPFGKAIFNTLAKANNKDAGRARDQQSCVATLLEAAGQPQDALQVWTKLRAETDDSDWVPVANAAIRRLSQAQQ